MTSSFHYGVQQEAGKVMVSIFSITKEAYLESNHIILQKNSIYTVLQLICILKYYLVTFLFQIYVICIEI